MRVHDTLGRLQVTGIQGDPGLNGFLLCPENAAFPTSNAPELKPFNGTNHSGFTLGFDKDTGESCFWTCKIPTDAIFTGATLKIVSRQLGATSGTLGWILTTLARGDGEAFDTAGNADTVTATTVKGTVGQNLFQSKALTVTGWDAGDIIQIKLTRDVANDTVAEDGEFVEGYIELT